MVNDREDASELDTFLPQSGQAKQNLTDDTTKITIVPAQKTSDRSNGAADRSTLSDPFKLRNVKNPTTTGETLAHLLKACLGSGILAMPYAFKNGGLLFGSINTIIVAIICAHCAYILVQCAHTLYYRLNVPSLTFPEVGEAAFANGPNCLKCFAIPARYFVIVGIFLTYFGTCCAYNVIISDNLEQIIKYHGYWTDTDKRYFIMSLTIPLLLLSYVPNLKSLAICSQIANVLMGCTIGITLVYIFKGFELYNPLELPQIGALADLPEFFCVIIFAMECIGVIMPLENNMKNPRKFLGTVGIMNQGMSVVTVLYFVVGLAGYLKYGPEVQAVITLNLPVEEIGSQCAKTFIAIAVFFTYGLQFYVCLDIAWNGIKDRIKSNQTLYNYLLRTILVILSVLISVAVPNISPFLSIVGALFFSSLGILFPAILERIVFWELGFGFAYWRLIKTIFIVLFGIFAVIFGTHSAIKGVIQTYSPVTVALQSNTTSIK